MNAKTLIGIALLVAGALGLAYGGFTYTKETHKADFGPVEISVTDEEQVSIPTWAGVGSILLGAGVLLYRKRR